MTATPATEAAKRAEVAFTVHEYDVSASVGEGYGVAVAGALGVPLGEVFKTLLALVDGDAVVAVIPVEGQLSTKALARAAGGKRCSLADRGDAGRLTGYEPGGISPLGQRRQLPTYVDRSIEACARVYVSAGTRHHQLELAAADLLELTDATVAALTRGAPPDPSR